MKSKTSFFNAAIFKNSISRFWPMWGAYAFVWALVLPISLSSMLKNRTFYGRSSDFAPWAVDQLLSVSLYAGLTIGLFAAALVSMAIWSFMYNSRSASGMASLPVSRGGMFSSVVLAGLLPAVVINFVISLLTFCVMTYYGIASFAVCMQSFCIITLIYIMCFGLATLCAQLTGNVFTLPAVFAVFNVVVVVVGGLVEGILSQFVYGFTGFSAEWTLYLSPPMGIARGCGFSYAYAEYSYELLSCEFYGWVCLLFYALVGLLFIAASLFLFKRRRMEAAGDVVAINILKPVFKYAMTFGCALVLGVFMAAIWFNVYDGGTWGLAFMLVFMALGAVIGYYSSEMLMRKSFRVFRGSAGRLCICLSIIIAFMFAFEFDLFGIERYTPKASEVSSAYIGLGGAMVDDAEQIEALIALHERVIADKADNEARTIYPDVQRVSFSIDYTLENGSVVRRFYSLAFSELRPSPTEDGGVYRLLNDLSAFVNTPELILERITPHFEVLNAGAISDCTIHYEVPAGTAYGGEGAYPADSYVQYYNSSQFTPYVGYTQSGNLQLSREDAFELYTTCILPDAADGTIGLYPVFYDADYYNNTTACNIYLQFQLGFGEDSRFDSRSVTVSMNSLRTLAWLEARGIPVYSQAELGYGYGVYNGGSSAAVVPVSDSDISVAEVDS